MTSPDTASPRVVEAGQRYQHVKRGTEYEVIGLGELQMGADLVDGTAVVIYRGDDGRLWAREESEFLDGRFRLSASASVSVVPEGWPGLSCVTNDEDVTRIADVPDAEIPTPVQVVRRLAKFSNPDEVASTTPRKIANELANICAALTTTPAPARTDGEGVVPAGMKPWHGGDAAPVDWDGGPVFRRAIGVVAVPEMEDDALEWKHHPHGRLHDLDIIGYTPNPAAWLYSQPTLSVVSIDRWAKHDAWSETPLYAAAYTPSHTDTVQPSATSPLPDDLIARIQYVLDDPLIHDSLLADHIALVVRPLLADAVQPSEAGEVEREARRIAQAVVPYDGHSPHVTTLQRERRRAAKAAARAALTKEPRDEQ